MSTKDFEQHIAQLEAAQRCAEVSSRISVALSRATNEQEILSALAGLAVEHHITMSSLAYARLDAADIVNGIDLVAIQDSNGQPLSLDQFPKTHVTLDELPILRLALETPDEPLFVENVFTDPRTKDDRNTLEMSRRMNVVTCVILWFVVGEQVQGAISLFWAEEHPLGAELRTVCKTIQPVAGAIVANRRLMRHLEQTVEERTAALQDSERAQRQSQQMLQMVLDTIPVRVFWKDKDLRYLGCNRLFAQDAGLESPEQIIGKDDYELSWAQIADLYRADDRAVIDSGEARLNFEEPQNREDGTKFWLRTSKTPLWDESGNIFGILGMYEDITTHKQAEEALRQSEEYYRALFTNSSEIYAILEPDGSLRYQSPSFERTFGYPVEETLGKSALEYIHPDDVATVAQAIMTLTQSPGSTQTITYRWKHRDGSWRILESAGVNLIHNAAIRGIVASSREVTERKQAEEALRESEEYYRALITNASDLLSILDADGNFSYVSPSFETSLGYTQDEIIGKRAFEFVHPDDMANVMQSFKRFVDKSPEREAVIFRWRRKDGSWLFLETNATNLLDNPAVRGVVVSSHDITERKQAEAEREALQQQVIEAQRQALAELSTPIIPIMDRIIVMPLIGGIDSVRSRDIMRSLLEGISRYRAQIAILDITGVPVVDSGVADHLNRTMQAARLKGAQTIITGVSDAVAETIVDLGIDWSGFEILRELQTGLVMGLERVGFQLAQRASGRKQQE
ncbi:MAG: PAS domain S-box protein [Candidatus Methanoperedens sp.]|nr:PAS domain S-box protein [Candidatus Methanoperedens sp.]